MKNRIFKHFLTFVIVVSLITVLVININAAKLTDNVELVGDVKSQEIWDGVTLNRMHVKAKRVGSTSADPTVYDWDAIAISAENNNSNCYLGYGFTIKW